MSQYHSLVLCRSRMQIPKKCCFTFCEIEDDQSIHLKEDCCRHFKIGLELFKKEEHISYRHRLFSRAISTLVIFSTIQISSISLRVSLSTSLYHSHTQTLYASLPFPFFSVTSSVIRKYTTSYILYVIHLQDVSCVCSKNLLKINSWWTYFKRHNRHNEKRSIINVLTSYDENMYYENKPSNTVYIKFALQLPIILILRYVNNL